MDELLWKDSYKHRIKQLYLSLVKFQTPVIVFTPGRVGSIAIFKALTSAGFFCFHTHKLSNSVWPNLQEPSVVHLTYKLFPYTKIVTIVKDPIAMMMSEFLNKLYLYVPPEKQPFYTINQYQDLFRQEYLLGEKGKRFTNWYSDIFRPAIGIDVYASRFNTRKQYKIIESKRNLLILSSHLDNYSKSNILGFYVNNSLINVEKVNQLQDKKRGDFKKNLKLRLKFSVKDLKPIYETPYAQHFFSKQQRNAFVQRWSRL